MDFLCHEFLDFRLVRRFWCNGEVGLLLLLFWVSVAKQEPGQQQPRTNTRITSLLLLSWADFSSVWRATSTLTKQRRAPKFHPRQIQSTCKPDNIHPNAGEATHQNKPKVRIIFLDICTNFTFSVKITKLPWKSKAFWDWKMQLLCLWYGLESLLERKHTILLIVLFPFTGKR